MFLPKREGLGRKEPGSRTSRTVRWRLAQCGVAVRRCEVFDRVSDAPVLHDIADVRVFSCDHPRRRPNGVTRIPSSRPRWAPRLRDAFRPRPTLRFVPDPKAEIGHGGQCLVNGANVGDEDGIASQGLLEELNLFAVVFFSVRNDEVGLEVENGLDVCGLGSTHARDGPKGRFGTNAELGLTHDFDPQLVEEFSPARNQGNNAHGAKVVRYLCCMNAPIRIAVVGCGHIGKRHAAMVRGHRETQLVAVADVLWENERVKGDIPARHWAPEARAFASLGETLQHVGVDVVAVCTPNGSHVGLAREAVAAGCHVILEKPMGLTVDGVEGLRREAEAAGKTVFGVMQNRYAPAAQWLKDTARSRGFGEVLQVHVQCLWNRDERYYTPGSWRGTLAEDGGPLFTQFSHFLDILMWVFGELHVEDAHFVNQTHQETTEFEDGGMVRFRLASGGWGSFTFSTSSPHGNFESSMTVMGTDGTVRIGGQYMDRVDEFALPGVQRPEMGQTPPPNDYGAYQGSAANHHHVYDNVANVLLRGDQVATPIEEGLAVVAAIEAMNRLGRR